LPAINSSNRSALACDSERETSRDRNGGKHVGVRPGRASPPGLRLLLPALRHVHLLPCPGPLPVPPDPGHDQRRTAGNALQDRRGPAQKQPPGPVLCRGASEDRGRRRQRGRKGQGALRVPHQVVPRHRGHAEQAAPHGPRVRQAVHLCAAEIPVPRGRRRRGRGRPGHALVGVYHAAAVPSTGDGQGGRLRPRRDQEHRVPREERRRVDRAALPLARARVEGDHAVGRGQDPGRVARGAGDGGVVAGRVPHREGDRGARVHARGRQGVEGDGSCVEHGEGDTRGAEPVSGREQQVGAVPGRSGEAEGGVSLCADQGRGWVPACCRVPGRVSPAPHEHEQSPGLRRSGAQGRGPPAPRCQEVSVQHHRLRCPGIRRRVVEVGQVHPRHVQSHHAYKVPGLVPHSSLQNAQCRPVHRRPPPRRAGQIPPQAPRRRRGRPAYGVPGDADGPPVRGYRPRRVHAGLARGRHGRGCAGARGARLHQAVKPVVSESYLGLMALMVMICEERVRV
ncbi:MOSC domain-containing protein, partial [Colletotrichum tofieldiae]